MSNKNFSDKRKLTYYLGIILVVIGAILFISTFLNQTISFGDELGDFDGFKEKLKNQMFRAGSAVILISIGTILLALGRRGIAGAGLILDTERERKDLEPINRMRGRQLNDALEEVDLKQHLAQNQIIKIKCQSCAHLNDEHDNFCSGCGKKI